MTNFERIKNMTLEELAEEIKLIAKWDRKFVKKADKYPQFYLEWLQSETETT